MLSNFERKAKLDTDLSKMDEDALNRLYLRVFNSDDGQLVLRDLENRCFVNNPIETMTDEGARRVYLSIQTRLSNSVTGKKEEENV